MCLSKNANFSIVQLQNVMMSISNFFGSTNNDYIKNDFDICGHDRPCFHALNGFERQSEFLQSFLDLIRVNFEPNILGTLFLNSNLGLMYDDILDNNYSFKYFSIVSDVDSNLLSFWNDCVVFHVKQCGYDFNNLKFMYVVVSTGENNYGLDFVIEANNIFESYFIKNCDEESKVPIDSNRIGFCRDDGLGTKIRMSIWMFCDKVDGQ